MTCFKELYDCMYSLQTSTVHTVVAFLTENQVPDSLLLNLGDMYFMYTLYTVLYSQFAVCMIYTMCTVYHEQFYCPMYIVHPCIVQYECVCVSTIFLHG